MALLLKKKHIINSLGEEQELNIYTTKTEAVDDGKPCKAIQVEVDGEMITGYIGCTDELDTPKASSKRVMVDGVEYAERKYMGLKSMRDYMKNTYPDTYQTMTELPDELPDTSDCTDFYSFFYICQKLENVPKIDTRNGLNFGYMYFICSSATEFPYVDTSNGINFEAMYHTCSKVAIFPNINTSKGTSFKYMYYGCSLATSVSQIDFSMAQDRQLTGLSATQMFSGCSSLRSITFNNLPIGTTEETLRSKCSIPDTVTEIIMNYRSA